MNTQVMTQNDLVNKLLVWGVTFLITVLLGISSFFAVRQVEAIDRTTSALSVLAPQVSQIQKNQQEAKRISSKYQESIAKDITDIRKDVQKMKWTQREMSKTQKKQCDTMKLYWAGHGCD